MHVPHRAFRGSAIILCLCATTARAQVPAGEHPIRWRATLHASHAGASAMPQFTAVVRATIPDGWYLYALHEPAGGPAATSFSGRALRITAPPTASRAEEHPDPNFNLVTQVYEDSAVFRVRVETFASTGFGIPTRPALIVHYQTCNDTYCLPPRSDTIVFAAVARDTAGLTATPATPPPERTVGAAAPSQQPPLAVYGAASEETSLSRFVWVAVSMGLLSILTPCVLPMVPVTLSMFGTGADTRRARRAVLATAYASGMVVTFAGVGLVTTAAFGAGGITRLAANPWLNLSFALLLAAFALNLLGAFEIRLPQRLLVNMSGSRDAPASAAGVGAAFLLGGAFAITSFTCTAPFVGTLLVLAAQGRYTWPAIGLTSYALAFATPFALLAFLPPDIRVLPRGGRWVMTVRRGLAVVELAAAVKFVSNADMVRHWGVFDRRVVLALWILAALALAVVLSGVGTRARRLQLLLALPALALAARLGLGWEGRRVGELEAYLPPPSTGIVRAGAEPPWILNDFDDARARAARDQSPLIVDFTGYTCTNCRWMEANMFPRPGVRALLSRYVRARLFTDGEGAPYEQQQHFEQTRFGTVALPFYAIFDRTGQPVATFLGMTRDSRAFERFLARGLDSSTVAEGFHEDH